MSWDFDNCGYTANVVGSGDKLVGKVHARFRSLPRTFSEHQFGGRDDKRCTARRKEGNRGAWYFACPHGKIQDGARRPPERLVRDCVTARPLMPALMNRELRWRAGALAG
jgi:hypothetical protein